MLFYAYTVPYGGVTHAHSGRLGDQITSYIHAKWVAYKYGLKLFYDPFEYSDQLALHDLEARYDKSLTKKLKLVTAFFDQPTTFDEDGILYTIPYFPHYPKSEAEFKMVCPIVIDWSDPVFVELLRKCIAPKKQLVLPTLNKNCFNIALHIRTGGGYDTMYGDHDPVKAVGNFSDIGLPTNHPREEYYIKQLTMILDFFKNVPVYVFIFTDDQNPEQFCIKYQHMINNSNVIFDCRTKANRHDKNVLEDFFAMQQFDCVICPNSNYSLSAARIGHNAITVFPVESAWQNAHLIMTKVKVDVKLRELQSLVARRLIDTPQLFKLLMA